MADPRRTAGDQDGALNIVRSLAFCVRHDFPQPVILSRRRLAPFRPRRQISLDPARPLPQRYWEEDPNFRHEAAPKPRLTGADYRPDYLSDKIGEAKRLQWTAEKFFVATEEEPLFDAADVLRFGRDMVVRHGFTTNLKGIEWLRRHFPDHRVHAVNFPGDPYPIHIDATFTPLRPGPPATARRRCAIPRSGCR
jgi:hypothetical protein